MTGSNGNFSPLTHCAPPIGGACRRCRTGCLVLISTGAVKSMGPRQVCHLGGPDLLDDVLLVVEVRDPLEDVDGPFELGVLADRGGPLLAGLGHVVVRQLLAGHAGDGVLERPSRVPHAFHRGVVGDGADGLQRLREEKRFPDGQDLGVVALLHRLLPEVGEVRGDDRAAADLAAVLLEVGDVLGEVLRGPPGRGRAGSTYSPPPSPPAASPVVHVGPGRAVGVVGEEEADLLVGLHLIPHGDEVGDDALPGPAPGRRST